MNEMKAIRERFGVVAKRGGRVYYCGLEGKICRTINDQLEVEFHPINGKRLRRYLVNPHELQYFDRLYTKEGKAEAAIVRAADIKRAKERAAEYRRNPHQWDGGENS